MKLIQLFCALIYFSAISGFSQIGTLDNSFLSQDIENLGDGSGFNSKVRAIVSQQDGKILFGGDFQYYNGKPINRLVRLNIDGKIDPTFNIGNGFNGIVYDIVIQPDQKIIVAGDFTHYNGVVVNRIVRLNTNGSIDPTFTSGNGFNNSVYDLEYLPDGKIMIAGDFTTYKGLPRYSIARLNQNGNIDAIFSAGAGLNGKPNSIKLLNNGDFAIGGEFSTYKGVDANNIVFINSNGGISVTISGGLGFDGEVKTIEKQYDGKLLIGGSFSSYNSSVSNNIIRLNTDGTLDNTLAIGNGFDGMVEEMLILSNNKILVSGVFSNLDNNPVNTFIKLNLNGTIDPNFDLEIENGQTIGAMFQDINANVYIGGDFLKISQHSANRYCKIVNNTIDFSFFRGSGFDANVRSFEIQDDGKILISGDFRFFNGQEANRLTRLNTNGSRDNNFNTGFGFNQIVYKSILQPDENIIVIGDFTTFNSIVGVNRICRLNPIGEFDSTLNTGVGFNNTVKDGLVQSDGKILLMGNFTMYNDTLANRLVKLNADGSIDQTFITGSGFNGIVNSFALQSDGKIIIIGGFTEYNGSPINRIARLNPDGTIDLSFNPGTGFNGSLNSVVIQNNGKIIIGGSFTFFNGIFINRIVRLNANGSLDLSFNIGTGFDGAVNKLLLNNNNKIIVGGSFTEFNGTLVKMISSLNIDGTIDNSFTNSTNSVGSINTLAIQNDEKILVGGTFISYENSLNNRFMRLIGQCSNSLATDIITSCGSYTWINGQTYTSNNNTATFSIPNATGCDSLITLNLTITNPNYQVTQTGITLIANQGNAIYQWIDCNNSNSPIIGETNQWFTPTNDGNYAVNITFNSCTGQSNCINFSTTSIDENHIKFEFYPNPNNGAFQIKSNLNEYTLSVFNSIGQKVYYNSYQNPFNEISLLNLPNGVYFVQIDSESWNNVYKIIISK